MNSVRVRKIMNSRQLQIVCAVLVALSFRVDGAVTMPSSLKHTIKGSFLSQQVGTVNDLVYEINNNSKVRARYARQYHMPITQVAKYFKQNLHIAQISSRYDTTDYYVRSNGTIYSHRKTLRAGSKVFALSNGRPVLQWSCGNPLSAALPDVQVKPSKIAKLPAKKRVEVASTPLPPVLAPYEKVAPYIASLPALPTSAPSAFGQTADFNVPISTANVFNPGLSPFLAAIPILAFHSNGGSSQSSVPAPAPEGSSIELWATGVLIMAGVAGLSKRRKSSSVS